VHLGPIKIRPLHLKIDRNIANRIHFSAQDVLNLVSGAKKEKPQQPTTETRIGHHCEDICMLYLAIGARDCCQTGLSIIACFRPRWRTKLVEDE